MGINKLYYRIFRPCVKGNFMYVAPDARYENYVRYINPAELSSLLSAAKLIIKDFENVFDYIGPCDKNSIVYSHRLFSLLVRIFTEIEANCSVILSANGYNRQGNWTMLDYCIINAATKLSEYQVEYSHWNPKKSVKSFEEWNNGSKLSWYQAYNHTKHNRFIYFSEAKMENVLYAICGLICLLYAQFGDKICSLSDSEVFAASQDYTDRTILSFHLTNPTFPVGEMYEFNRVNLSQSTDPYQQYKF